MADLTLYVRADCHLCDDALAIIEEARALTSLSLEIVDIEGDPLLEAYYGERVPVLVRGSEVIAQGAIDDADVLEVLLR